MNAEYMPSKKALTRLIDDVLEQCAAADLHVARRDGELLLPQSKLGALRLEYRGSGLYYLTKQATGQIVAFGKGHIVKDALLENYVVEHKE